jgi:membrane protein required for colicin V production
MTPFDYVVLGVLALSVLLGMLRGAVSEILALVAWVAAFFAGRAFALEVGAAFQPWLAEPALQYVAGFATVVVGVLLVFALARFLLRGLLRAVGLGLTDRALGALFGVARAGVIALIAVLIGGMTALPREPWWREAKLAPPLETAAVALKPWLPQAMAKRIRYR